MSDSIYTHKDFISNKYSDLYFRIIENRLKTKYEGYTESHHIIPDSMGGSDDNSNIVDLSAREHFICHYLLKKFTVGSSYIKMVSAFHFMSITAKSHSSNNRYINSKLFEASRVEFSKCQSISVSNSWKNGSRDNQLEWMKQNSPFKNPETHAKSMATRKERGTNVFETNNPMYSEETKIKKLESMPDMKGRKCWYNEITGDKKQQINKPEGEGWIQRGHKYGLTTKGKGQPKPRIPCPHCGNDYPVHTMNRHIKARHG